MPCLRLQRESLVVITKTQTSVRVALIDLSFEYDGGERDREGERYRRMLLERQGAVEVDCVDGPVDGSQVISDRGFASSAIAILDQQDPFSMRPT